MGTSRGNGAASSSYTVRMETAMKDQLMENITRMTGQLGGLNPTDYAARSALLGEIAAARQQLSKL